MSVEAWRLIRSGYRDGCYNMAVDEALFLSVKEEKAPPTLRFYGFSPACLSLGYSQRAEKEIDLSACRSLGIDVVRRPTGGRAVLHKGDITYSVVARFPWSLKETYRYLSLALARGLRSLGVEAQLAPARPGLRPGSPDCFASPSWYELLVGGKKIAGSAQKRDHNCFLQHGSILIDLPSEECRAIFGRSSSRVNVSCINENLAYKVGFAQVEEALLKGFQEILRIPLVEEELTVEEEWLTEKLRREQYLSYPWKPV